MPSNGKIGIFLFDYVDPLDVFGPIEVFDLAGLSVDLISFQHLVSLPQNVKIACKIIEPEDAYELLVVPGGKGLTDVLKNTKTLEQVTTVARNAQYIASVCAGSLLLAACGLLNGKKASTHWQSKSLLTAFPEVKAVNERVTLDGNIYTSSGITAGIDLSLTYIEHRKGELCRKEVELKMEYRMRTNTFEEDFVAKEYDDRKVKLTKDFTHVLEQRRTALKDLLSE